jgi:Tfp pilus assembly PilM family ATPase
MTFHKIFNAFPPPKFLDIPYAGISISDTTVRCIKFTKKDKILHIEKYSEKTVPVGVISSGEINDKDVLIKILQDLKKDLNLDHVKISLPEEKAYLFTAKIPKVKKDEVLSAIESKIEENVPVSPAELLFDYKVLDHHKKDQLDVVVSALPIDVIDTYVEVATGAGLSLLSLEIESQAIARSLLKPDNLDTVLIVNFGQEKVGLYVVSERIVHFTSTIITRGESLNNPDFLSQEIKKLYVYWHTLKENVDKAERKISQIIVCGENVDDSVVPYISAHNGAKVTLGDVWANVFNINTHVPEITFIDSLRYPAAIGLALPSSILIYK